MSAKPKGLAIGDELLRIASMEAAPSARRQDPVYSYTLKKNGKVISGKDVHLRALMCMALTSQAEGQCNGIVRLLLPDAPRKLERARADLRRYELCKVKIRSSGHRKHLREQARNANILIALIVRCPPESCWPIPKFTQWLIDELARRDSPARQYLVKVAPDLIEAGRSYSWWYRQLSKKMSR